MTHCTSSSSCASSSLAVCKVTAATWVHERVLKKTAGKVRGKEVSDYPSAKTWLASIPRQRPSKEARCHARAPVAAAPSTAVAGAVRQTESRSMLRPHCRHTAVSLAAVPSRLWLESGPRPEPAISLEPVKDGNEKRGMGSGGELPATGQTDVAILDPIFAPAK